MASAEFGARCCKRSFSLFIFSIGRRYVGERGLRSTAFLISYLMRWGFFSQNVNVYRGNYICRYVPCTIPMIPSSLIRIPVGLKYIIALKKSHRHGCLCNQFATEWAKFWTIFHKTLFKYCRN
jgi:uncharacterized membrane protein YozB (DUF420 family)